MYSRRELRRFRFDEHSTTQEQKKKEWRKTTWNKRQRFSTAVYIFILITLSTKKIWKRFWRSWRKKSHVVRFKCKHYSFSACKIRLISVESKKMNYIETVEWRQNELIYIKFFFYFWLLCLSLRCDTLLSSKYYFFSLFTLKTAIVIFNIAYATVMRTVYLMFGHDDNVYTRKHSKKKWIEGNNRQDERVICGWVLRWDY